MQSFENSQSELKNLGVGNTFVISEVGVGKMLIEELLCALITCPKLSELRPPQVSRFFHLSHLIRRESIVRERVGVQQRRK